MSSETLTFSGRITQFRDFTEGEPGRYYTNADPDHYRDRASQEAWTAAQISEAVSTGNVTTEYVLCVLDVLAEGAYHA